MYLYEFACKIKFWISIPLSTEFLYVIRYMVAWYQHPLCKGTYVLMENVWDGEVYGTPRNRHCTKNCERNKVITPTFRNKSYREEEQWRKGQRQTYSLKWSLFQRKTSVFHCSLLSSLGGKSGEIPERLEFPWCTLVPRWADAASPDNTWMQGCQIQQVKGTYPAVQRLIKTVLPVQGALVWSLFRALKHHMLCSMPYICIYILYMYVCRSQLEKAMAPHSSTFA